jgi:hypothetical protein
MFRLSLIGVQRDECGMNGPNNARPALRNIAAKFTAEFCSRERNGGFLPQLRTIARAARSGFDRMGGAGYQAATFFQAFVT